jgi:iron-sulfur cluster protein
LTSEEHVMIDTEQEFRSLKKSVYKAAKSDHIRTALRRAVASFRKNRDAALARFPDVLEKRKILREKKEEAISRLDELIPQAMEAMELNHVKPYLADTVEDALAIIDDIIGTGKTVVKAKSITSEELDLNAHLEEKGNTVYETDLGEFIVQLLGQRPMHILAPAVNVPREKVQELFSKVGGEELPTDPAKLTMFARRFLRQKYMDADVGFSGANALVAETGSLYLIENEGNIRFATNAPPVYVALVGVEKILPTNQDATLLLDVVQRYAGYYMTSFVSIISGPSKTGDIEKVTVYGAHGPKEMHVILLDAGRRALAKDPELREALYCVRCGACMYECPVYPITTGHWGYRYMGGIGIPWTAFISGGLKKAGPMAYGCVLCGRCKEFCPVEIDGPPLVQRVREAAAAGQVMPAFVKTMTDTVLEKGNPYKQ